MAAGNENGRAAVYDTATGRVLRTIAVKGYSVLSMALSSGGEWLATNDSSGAVEVWRTDTGERVSGCLIPEWDGAGLLTFAPNGKILVAASADGSALHIIRPRTGQISTLRGGHNGRINDVVFSNDGGHMATVGLDAVIRLWSLPNGLPAQPRTVSGHTGAIYTATFSPDGKSLLTGGYDGVIRVWDVATFQEVLALSGRWKRRPISSLQFDRSGATMLSTDADGTTRFWNGVATPRK
ncbi:MAG: hypothetical protein H7145_22070 [Akkermansiaceae bacterium]|nr:hypothetical protein [Armatimonadota bacterium]